LIDAASIAMSERSKQFGLRRAWYGARVLLVQHVRLIASQFHRGYHMEHKSKGAVALRSEGWFIPPIVVPIVLLFSFVLCALASAH
jgi:uncharacterized membrane protein